MKVVEDDDFRPRLIPIEGGGTAFFHPCASCGVANAPFGFDVSLRHGRPGRWSCYLHRGVVSQTEVAEKIVKKVRISPVEPVTIQPVVTAEPILSPPKQGDLF